ncbi:hypothetical protein LCGC14_1290220 [marine sediment metagenome]|uniref:DNA2/NAM7 helicase-like C-terminal domain-containing protein n=1 Tax=marine sediment metagenome TaxID=412755 RepID=A0A0F9LDM2_9ZZZZ
MSYNNFNKQLLTRYTESECKRQLFLDLAQIKPDLWYTDNRPIERIGQNRLHIKLLPLLGKIFEQKVYSHLIKFNGVKFNVKENGEVDETYLNPRIFEQFYDQLMKKPLEDILLLEFQFETPESFFNEIFPPKNEYKEIPVNYGEQRPDIIILGNSFNKRKEKIIELLSDGAIREVPKSELITRFGIVIIDIKNIREDHIGKKQFIEILYYLWTLTSYLSEHKLNDKFFVRIDFNGIFPQYSENILKTLHSLDDFLDLTIQLHWEQAHQVFRDIIQKIKKLWTKAPIPIEATPVNIQPSCGYCYFIEDCKKTLGIDGEPCDWSLQLIPYTSFSISKQLLGLGFKTISDVSANIDSIKVGNTPEPLYAELPLLKLKALALINNQVVIPHQGEIHTYSIPRFTTISITFAVETDPANERVYAVGFFVDMVASGKTPYGGVFNNWWKIWKDALDSNKKPKEIQTKLNENLIRPIPLVVVEQFLYILKKLKKIIIYLKGDKTKSGVPRKSTEIIYQFAIINKGHTNDEEIELTKNIIKRLYTIFELCNVVENYVVTDGYKAGTYYGPTTSLFYWAKRQLNNFQTMFERNINNIIDDIDVWGKYSAIISYFTPSDSEVAHPYQHKKLFNVQDFAETILGFPCIISYTWHEIAKIVKGINSSKKFWIQHFNYMDFNNWYLMVVEDDPSEKKNIRLELRRQVMHKIRTINNLRKVFQIESRYVISKHARVISKEEIRRAILPSDYHSIAQVWFLFSKLTGSMEETDTEYFRTIYPEFSIAKLAAAKVSNLVIRKIGIKKVYYEFQMKGLSSNMKIRANDRVLLIPNEKRDMSANRRMEPWKVTIESMEWLSHINGYKVITKETSADLFDMVKKDKEISESPENLDWYLYPTYIDAWSKKLYGENALLQRYNMGRSWLGSRLSYLWKIRSKQELFWPENWTFSAPSVYLYAPNLLLEMVSNSKETHDKLLTQIEPSLDPSQERSIHLALEKVISGIQGPPGTGKSQTIAALIDEYYIRCINNGKKSVKILVTSFSYAAIRVLIKKIREGKDKSGKPTPSSQIQMMFLHSMHQKPILSLSGCREVDDLISGSTWKLNNQPYTVTKSRLLEESLENCYIIFANAHQLYFLPERVEDDFSFDLICVDEASQLQVDHFMSSLQFVKKHKFVIKPKFRGEPNILITDIDDIKHLSIENNLDPNLLTKIVIVGDYNQLPPVQPVPPPKNLESILKSLFVYYVKNHEIPNSQLQTNYRSHKDIVNYTSQLGFYEDLKPDPNNMDRTIKGNINNVEEKWVQEILEPQKVVSCIIHKKKFEIGVSALESYLVVKIIIGYFKMVQPVSKAQERVFWRETVGVVAPHNAQGRLIIRQLYDKLIDPSKPLTCLNHSELMNLLINTIYSVEKFQGSDRELIISSIGISDKDQLNAESEFIYNINRFNVLTSRAKSKIILIASKRFFKYIPNDRNIMEEAAHIRNYALNYCNKSVNFSFKDEKNLDEFVEFRYKD